MTRRSGPTLPQWPERLVQFAMPRDARALSVVGDLREEFAQQPANGLRDARYAIACLALACRYAPGRLASRARTWRVADLFRGLVTDVRQGIRALAHAPAYLASAALTLVVAMSALATIGTVVYGTLLRPLPFPEARELVRVGATSVNQLDACCSSVSVADFLDLQQRLTLVRALAAHSIRPAVVSSDQLNERVTGAEVTTNFLDVLGMPLRGRGLTDDDARPGGTPVVVISEQLARRHFGDSTPIGRTLSLDLVPHTVVGVAPDEVFIPGAPQFWRAFQWSTATRADRRHHNIEPIARLRPGVTVDQARAELRSVFAGIAREHPADIQSSTMAVRPFDDWIAESAGTQSRAMLPLIGAGAIALFLVAMINVTSLALGRAERRRGEQSIRLALGSSAGRTVRRELIDTLLLIVPATCVAALLSSWFIRIVMATYGAGLPRAESVAFDVSTLLVLLASSAVAASALGAIAATSALRTGGRRIDTRTTSPAALRTRRALVTAQVALGGTLLYGALLVGATIWQLSQVDLGVAADHTLTFAVAVPRERYGTTRQVAGFFRTLTDRIAQLPGVVSVGGTSRRPLNGGTNGGVRAVEDPAKTLPLAEYRSVTPDAFRALGLRWIAGSTFAGAAPADDARRMVISDTLARALFGGSPAVGKHVTLEGTDAFEIIGVVSDIRDFGPTAESRPTLYVRHGSSDDGWVAIPQMTMIVRTGEGAPDLWPELRATLHAVDRDVVMDNPVSLATLAKRSVGVPRRTASSLLSLFTGAALALAAIGIFGIVMYSVERRRREIGIRLALGDTPAGIRGRTIREGVVLAVVGIALAAVGMAWMDRLLTAFVVASARPHTATLVVVVASAFIAVAAAASAIPARRAARVSTVDLLKSD